MKTFIALIILAAAMTGMAFARTDQSAEFRSAEKLYQENRFPEAVTAYEALVASCGRSAALYYNLGNAYFRSGRIGRARASFERAARIAPRDSDIRHNITIARRAASEPEKGLSALVGDYILGLASLSELAVLTSAGFMGACATGGLFLLLRRRRFAWLAGILLAWTVFFGGWAAWKYSDQRWSGKAVIVDGTAEARSGPGMENAVSFTVPDGREVVISGGQDGWIAVTLPREGLTGWVQDRSVERY